MVMPLVKECAEGGASHKDILIVWEKAEAVGIDKVTLGGK